MKSVSIVLVLTLYVTFCVGARIPREFTEGEEQDILMLA